MRKKRKTKRQTVKFQKVAVIAVLTQVFVYTWVHLIFSFIAQTEISPTVSCAFYTFCGAEAGILAYLKSFDKKQKGENNNERTDFSETDEP